MAGPHVEHFQSPVITGGSGYGFGVISATLVSMDCGSNTTSIGSTMTSPGQSLWDPHGIPTVFPDATADSPLQPSAHPRRRH